MRIVIVYRERSDHAREVEDWTREFSRRTGEELEVVDPDTRDGADFCRLYDIVEYPTIVALCNNGELQDMWRGRPLPQINEVSAFLTI